MSDAHGDFVWYELMVKDVDAAKAFYGPLLGWDFAEGGVPGMEYWLIRKDGTEIAGLMPISDEMEQGGARPLWAGYVGVNDVDDSAAQAKSAGATIFVEPTDIPDIGRFAFMADPQGAPIYIMRGNSDQPSESFAKYQPREGHCAWNELMSADPQGAKAFYGELFGWAKTDEIDMGEMGKYEMLQSGDCTFGGLMGTPPDMQSMWVYYFRVPEITPAKDYVEANGGQVINGPMEIPGGDYIINGIDPQGAMFALIGAGPGE